MGRFRDKLVRFMYGRYGNDKFGNFLVIVYFALWLVNLFVNSLIVYGLSATVLIYWIFRIMSRNIHARQKENQVFLRVYTPIGAWFKLQIDRIKEIKTHRYRKCKYCRAVLRLPKKKGKHTVRCPKCGERFEVNIVI